MRLPVNAMVRRARSLVRSLNSGRIDAGELEANKALLMDLEKEFAPHMARFEQMRQVLRERRTAALRKVATGSST